MVDERQEGVTEQEKAAVVGTDEVDEGETHGHGKGWWRLTIEIAAATLGLVLVLTYLAGAWRDKIEPGSVAPTVHAVEGKVPLAVRRQQIPRYEWAVGTIQSVNETALGSKILAKVVEVNVRAGQAVEEGDVVVRLDDRDLHAQAAQAQAEVDAAEARLNQAQVDYDRIMGLAEQDVATQHEINTVQNELRAAKAGLERARQALEHAQTLLSYATIQAPFAGVVVDKQVEVGDMVGPGQLVVRLYDPTRMQLVATVRESLARHLAVGNQLGGYIPALERMCTGRVAEIVPQAQVQSRSFDVKLVGPCQPGIYSGMFGRLLIPLGSEEVLLIPASAVIEVGQLDLVDVAADGEAQRRSVQLGRTFGQWVEVLSGLEAGQDVLVPEDRVPTVQPGIEEALEDALPATQPATAPATGAV